MFRLTEVPCSDKLEWQPYDSLSVSLGLLNRQKETSSDSNTCKYCLDNLLALSSFVKHLLHKPLSLHYHEVSNDLWPSRSVPSCSNILLPKTQPNLKQEWPNRSIVQGLSFVISAVTSACLFRCSSGRR